MTPERWRQIEELYHAAQANGAGVLAGVPSDLRQEVECLLEQGRSGNILDQPLSALLESSPEIPIAAGSQLGPYRVEQSLGAGGMGQVYRATDTRLDRAVAIKVVPQHFSARFEREARAISSLNHPHICTLYDVGPNYLVLELIPGSSLADRLKKGPLPLEQTIRYGIQIADALAAAHARGIVHRDLKPGNIMVSKSGIKVLDFGLALSATDETLTASQMVIGTPAYMAPEQREGGTVDARTDIYALGLVLYEMAVGKRPGRDHSLPLQGLPRELAHIIDRCLAADPNERWQAASDVRAELEWAGTVQPAAKTLSSKLRLALVSGSRLRIRCNCNRYSLADHERQSGSHPRSVSFHDERSRRPNAGDLAGWPLSRVCRPGRKRRKMALRARPKCFEVTPLAWYGKCQCADVVAR